MVCRNGKKYRNENESGLGNAGLEPGFWDLTWIPASDPPCVRNAIWGKWLHLSEPSASLPVEWGWDWDQLRGLWRNPWDRLCVWNTWRGVRREWRVIQLAVGNLLFFTGKGGKAAQVAGRAGAKAQRWEWTRQFGACCACGILWKNSRGDLGSGGEDVPFEWKPQKVNKAPLGVGTHCSLLNLSPPSWPLTTTILPVPSRELSVQAGPQELGWCSIELIYVVYLLHTINHKLADSFVAIN